MITKIKSFICKCGNHSSKILDELAYHIFKYHINLDNPSILEIRQRLDNPEVLNTYLVKI
jgi:hypothetical protein